MKRLILSASLSAIASVLGAPALAQDAAGAPPEATPADPAVTQGLEEIVVTAQRRTENLQNVPIAASVLAGDQLENKAVDRIENLQYAVPALSVTDQGETQSVNIRGIGLSSNSPNVSNGVATYVDGLFQPPIVTAVPFYDIASIEVLRGPQGTLVGNNSTGGAIFINSNNPKTGQIAGYAQASYGNYDAFEAEGAVNLPLTGTLAVRAAGIYRRRDSFYDDVGPFDNEAGKLDEKGGRIGMLWKPGAFQALLKLQWHDQDTGGFAYRPAEGTQFFAYRAGDERTLNYDSPTSHIERSFQASLELRYELGNSITLRSLSGYQNKRNNFFQDIDATQAPVAAGGTQVQDYFAQEKQYSEEINIISPTDGRFDWILGGYFQKNDITVDIRNVSPFPPVFIQPLNGRKIYGIFGQGNYELHDGLELQLGLRYSHFKATGSGDVRLGVGAPGFPPGGIVLADLSGAHKDSRVTGKAALNWQVDRDNLFYAFVARGYKPGGFNNVASEFSPETVWDYEIGWKGTLADGRLRTQVGAFYNDYKGLQFDVIEPATGTGGVRNVASATVKGIEAQVQGRFGGFGFDASAAYVDSKLDGLTFVNTRAPGFPAGQLGPQCPPGTPSSPPVCFDYAPFIITTNGGPNLYSPKWTFTAGAQYTIEMGDWSLTPRINYGYIGPRWNFIAYGPGDRLAGRGLFSALLTLEMGDWRIEGYATNLTDKTYVSGRSGDNEFYGAPREYGVRVGMSF